MDTYAIKAVLCILRCKSAVLALHYEPQFMAAGGFDKKVYHIDPRTATIIAEKRIHKKPVLDVTANDKFIITGSEDSTIAIYDRRADAVLKTLEVRTSIVYTIMITFEIFCSFIA